MNVYTLIRDLTAGVTWNEIVINFDLDQLSSVWFWALNGAETLANELSEPKVAARLGEAAEDVKRRLSDRGIAV